MQTIVHRASERGKGEYGWLSTRYSFSFADWYEPSRMGFGKLRVINDDIVAPEHGFDMHQHRDMEIITIVMRGTVTHKDSMGNIGTVSAGEAQAMSAGTGVVHAEYNDSADEPLELFQIWIEPAAHGVPPRYAQGLFEPPEDGLALLVSPDGRDESLPAHQDIFLWQGRLPAGAAHEYALRDSAHGVYLLVIDGTLQAAGQKLGKRDALGVWDTSTLEIHALEESRFLLIEVPH